MDILKELKEYALLHKVPIIKDEGLDFLLKNIQKYNVKRVLEIGTAIGYSAIAMSKYASVLTIERNKEMINEAIKNFKKANSSNITLIEGDALEVEVDGEFDLIFIDAAKAQYEKFFNKYTKLLKKGGLVICDNLSFHGLVQNKEENMSRNLRSLVRKIEAFNSFLLNNQDYETHIYYEIGDGVSLSIKK